VTGGGAMAHQVTHAQEGDHVMTTQPYFDAALFAFLEALHSNNNREWFQTHKQRYGREVRDPMFRFIGDFGREC